MDLGIPGVRASARAAAEARMQDQCIIYRRVEGNGNRDPETGTIVYPEPEVIYGPDIQPHRGKCRLRMPYAAGAALVDGGTVTVLQQTHIGLPADVVLKRGDEVKVVRSDNPLLVGQKLTVKPLPEGSQQSANRYGVEAVH